MRHLKIFVLFWLITIVITVNAQIPDKSDHPKLYHIGASFGSKGYQSMIENNLPSSMVWEFPTITTTVSPTITFFGERNLGTVFDNCYIAIGGEYSYEKATTKANHGIYYYVSTYSYYGTNNMSIGYIAARLSLNYVLPEDPKLRFYGYGSFGIMMLKSSGSNVYTYYDSQGLYSGSDTQTYSDSKYLQLVQSYVGVRYFFVDPVSIFAEGGYGLAYAKIGLNLRF